MYVPKNSHRHCVSKSFFFTRCLKGTRDHRDMSCIWLLISVIHDFCLALLEKHASGGRVGGGEALASSCAEY